MQTTYFTICMTQEDYILQSQLRYQKAYRVCSHSRHQQETVSYFGIYQSSIFLALPTMTFWRHQIGFAAGIYIDPSKNLKYYLHLLSQLKERVNETSQHDIAESQILAIIYEEM